MPWLRLHDYEGLRAIEDLIPILYPGVRVSYGKVQQISVEAESRAATYNTRADLSPIRAAALDEMFSQGEPVLAGVDLDSGYLLGLALRESRSGEDWADVLRTAKEQGLGLEVVVKAGAKGIASGVTEVFPNAEHRDDCFHAHYEMGKVRRRLEQQAYGAISRELEAEQELDKVRRTGRGKRSQTIPSDSGKPPSRSSQVLRSCGAIRCFRTCYSRGSGSDGVG